MSKGFKYNVNDTRYDKQCLLKYITEPFTAPITCHWHQNLWQVPELARILGEFGYNVDVANYNITELPAKQYDLLIDILPADQSLYEGHLRQGCLKVVYATGAGPTWHNRQVMKRVNDLNTRRGAKLGTVSHVSVTEQDISGFDAMFMFGNRFTRETFGTLAIPTIFPIRNTGYPFLARADCTGKSPACFLFFASKPQVLKGLDLLLEVFARNPELTLVVCSLYKTEPDFCAVYERELHDTANIIPVGFVNIESELFRKITGVCSYTILPSCSEAAAGSVLTAMSAGMIPIVSRECGFDDGEVLHLEDCSISCIEETVKYYAGQSREWIARQSAQAIDVVRQRYSPGHFSESVRSALRGLLSDRRR